MSEAAYCAIALANGLLCALAFDRWYVALGAALTMTSLLNLATGLW